jgi:hypothetical protein
MLPTPMLVRGNACLGGTQVKHGIHLNRLHRVFFETIGDHRTNLVSAWNALETVLTHYTAILATSRGRRQGSTERTIKNQLAHTLQYFSRHKIQLRPIAVDLSSLYDGSRNRDTLQMYNANLLLLPDILSTNLVSAIFKTVSLLK